MTTLVIWAAVIILAIYLIMDLTLFSPSANEFIDKWLKKTLWIWLPFYALIALIKELVLGRKK